NPNNIEFNNLYLDMNDIIHLYCYLKNKSTSFTEKDMIVEIIEYTERIVAIICLKKVLYLAIDSIALHTKTNQQKFRRFKAV
ncbi:putative 5-3 exonuclease, partial [Rhizophagus irregularis]